MPASEMPAFILGKGIDNYDTEVYYDDIKLISNQIS